MRVIIKLSALAHTHNIFYLPRPQFQFPHCPSAIRNLHLFKICETQNQLIVIKLIQMQKFCTDPKPQLFKYIANVLQQTPFLLQNKRRTRRDLSTNSKLTNTKPQNLETEQSLNLIFIGSLIVKSYIFYGLSPRLSCASKCRRCRVELGVMFPQAQTPSVQKPSRTTSQQPHLPPFPTTAGEWERGGQTEREKFPSTSSARSWLREVWPNRTNSDNVDTDVVAILYLCCGVPSARAMLHGVKRRDLPTSF